MKQHPHTSGRLHPGAVVAGALTFILLLVVIPLLATGLPVAFTWPVHVVYVLWAILASAALISLGDRTARAGRTFAIGVVSLALGAALAVAPLVGMWWLIDAVVPDDFSTTTIEDTAVSPSGRLTATVVYKDDGALGGYSHVKVEGDLIPGLVSWDVLLADGVYFADVEWADDGTVLVDSEPHALPLVLATWNR